MPNFFSTHFVLLFTYMYIFADYEKLYFVIHLNWINMGNNNITFTVLLHTFFFAVNNIVVKY